MKQTNVCPICGGKLEKHDNQFVCLYCKNTFEEENVLEIEEKLNSLLDEFKQELVANTRTQLWDALHEKYISSDKILDITRIIKTYLPEDFMANFFEFVNTKSNTQESINKYINNINYKENYIYIDLVLDFMIRSLEPSNLLCLNNLIENTYKNTDLKLYNDYTSRLSAEAEKVEKGVYDLNAERDVFIAYSSKDIKYVEELTKELEKNGITYFVALKNLRHGKGAVENYDEALEQAIENSKTFLFISSENSRTRECDALKKEIPYLKKLDKLNAPAEYRNDYAKIPLKYKKPRVQLLIGNTPTGTAADNQIAEIFDGYEWRYDIKSAVDSVYNFLSEEIETETEADRIRKELEEKQAKQIEELKKMMAEMMANQNTSKEQSKPKKEESSKEEPKKQEELKKNLSFDSSKVNTKQESNSSVVKEGNTITFGSYYNEDDKNLEPLKWDILEEKDGKVLIITHDIIDSKEFDINKSNNYEKSSIRQWLNNDFYNIAFDAEEKEIIQTTLVDNSPLSTSKKTNKYACNDTNDKLFLLSYNEAKKYYKTDNNREAKGTNYAKINGLYDRTNDTTLQVLNITYNGTHDWWLRSPTSSNIIIANYVGFDGYVSSDRVENNNIGVRPACWIKLD